MYVEGVEVDVDGVLEPSVLLALAHVIRNYEELRDQLSPGVWSERMITSAQGKVLHVDARAYIVMASGATRVVLSLTAETVIKLPLDRAKKPSHGEWKRWLTRVHPLLLPVLAYVPEYDLLLMPRARVMEKVPYADESVECVELRALGLGDAAYGFNWGDWNGSCFLLDYGTGGMNDEDVGAEVGVGVAVQSFDCEIPARVPVRSSRERWNSIARPRV